MPRRSPGSALGDEVAAIHDGVVRLRRGGWRMVLASSSLNFLALAEDQQTRTVQAFRDLLHAQTGPLQLYLRIRRIAAGPAPDDPQPQDFDNRPDYFRALTESFIDSHLRESPVFRREHFIVLGSLSSRDPWLRSWRVRLPMRDSGTVTELAVDAGGSLRDRARQLTEQLRRMGIASHALDDDELRALYGLGPAAAAEDELGVSQHAGAVEIAGRWSATLTVERYPGEGVEPGWLLPLTGFPGELEIAIHIVPQETDRVLGVLRRRMRDLSADELTQDSATATAATATVDTLPDVVTAYHAMARNEERGFTISLYLTVSARNLTELNMQIESLTACCRRLMLKVSRPFFQMAQGVVSTWPLGVDLLGRDHLVHTGAAATFFPWLQEDLADRQGHYWGYNRDTGGLVIFDPFDESRFQNANVAVLAHSGAGKSYAAASLILSGYARGVGAIILDPEAEYGGLVRGLGGSYLNLAAGSGHAINALDPLIVIDPEDPLDRMHDVLDLFSLMCGTLEPVERAEIEHAVREVMTDQREGAVLGDIVAVLRRRRPSARCTTVLQRWVSGDLGRLFSAPTNVDLGADVVGFNLRDLQEEVIAPAYFLLASWLWSVLRRDRRRRHLLVDEAGLLLEHEPIRRFMVRLARRIRKYQGSLILVSQNPGDLFDTRDGAVLATNPSLLLLGSQKRSEAIKLQRAYSLTEPQVNFLETAERGDFLLVAGLNRIPLHVMAAPWMDELIVGSQTLRV
jgi:hypothetical protein